MYTVYILKSVKDGTFYTGLTNDFRRRKDEHDSGKESSTRNHRPYEVIFTKQFETRIEARKLEKKLKSGHIREKRKNLIEFLEFVEQL